jgi:hypothetical protein
MSEKKLFIAGSAALAIVVALALFAAKQATAPSDMTKLEDLPLSTYSQTFDPDPSDCEAAGGEVRYERSSQCFSEPDVHDVCGFGVPCFDGGQGYRCIDVKDPYCACTSDDQCPDGYGCDKGYAPDRCIRNVDENGPPPYPAKPIYR